MIGENCSTHATLMEAYRRSEKRLEVQQEFAIASDQRSLVLAGVGIAAAAFIANSLDVSDWALLFATMAFCACSVAAILAALPQAMYTAGSHAADLWDPIENGAAHSDVIKALCLENDRYIDANESKSRIRATLYRSSVLFFFLGALTFAAVTLTRFVSAAL